MLKRCPDCNKTSEAWEVACNHCGFPALQSEGINVAIDTITESPKNQGSSQSSDLNKLANTSTPSSTANILTFMKSHRAIVLGLTLTLAVASYVYLSREKAFEGNATDNSQLVSEEIPETVPEDSPVFEAPPAETNVEKAIRVTSENQHHFMMGDDMTMIAFFEDRQRQNAKTDPSMTISEFRWVGESLSDNPNKVKVEYQSYPTEVTCRWYW